MGIVKIIHIIIGQLPIYNYKALCIKKTQELGAKVEVWDLAPMCQLPKTQQKDYKEIIIEVQNKNHLKKLIQTNQTALFVTAINFEKRFFYLFFYLARYKCKHAKIANGWIREYGISTNKTLIFLRYFFKKHLLTLCSFFRLISLPDTFFIAGNYWNKSLPNNPKIIPCNHLLYDEFLEVKNTLPLKNKAEYVLFLDEAHATHPDWELCNMIPLNGKITAQEYYQKMQKVFDLFEEKYQLPVVIAAHPKAQYTGDEFGVGAFGKRKIIANQTMKLSFNAKAFIAHSSTSRLLAILQQKPIYLIRLSVFDTYLHPISTLIANDHLYFCQETGSVLVEEKNNYSFEAIQPNLDYYHKYLYTYYTSKETENTYTLDIIAQKLVELCNEKN